MPLAVVGLGGVLALVLLQGEQPGEQAAGRPVQTTSRSTLVSVHRSEVAAVPISSGASGPEAPVEERREAVRSGQRPTTASAAPAAPTAEPSTVEARRRGEPRTHRHRQTSTATPPPSTAAPTSPAAPPSTVPDSTPADPTPTESADPITPDPTPAPVPPSSDPVPAPEHAPEH